MSHRRPIPTSARAMTLLEVLLAVTIMASLMGLVASLLGQARSWTDVSETDRVLMRLQRVGEAMRTQWSDRRSSVALDGQGNRVITTPEQLSFLTATPILFPEWPLVAATYRIEPEATRGSSRGLTWRLIYEETRIAGMDALPGDYALDARGAALRDSMVLLAGCAELEWERFGQGERLAEDGASDDDDGQGDDDPGGTPESGPNGASGLAESGLGEDRALDEERRFRWRAFTSRYEGFVPAVRLVGQYEREPIGWVFVIKALR